MAVAVGAVIAVQVFVVSRASLRFDVLVVSMVLQAAGLVAGLVWTSAKGAWPEVWAIARAWWWIPVGLAGWVIVGALGFVSARLGVALTLAISIGVQLTVGLGLDAAGGRPIGLPAVAGVLMVTAGAVLVSIRA